MAAGYNQVIWISENGTDCKSQTRYVLEEVYGPLPLELNVHIQVPDQATVCLVVEGKPIPEWQRTTIGEIRQWLREKADRERARQEQAAALALPRKPTTMRLDLSRPNSELISPGAKVEAPGTEDSAAPVAAPVVIPAALGYTEADRQIALAQPEDLDE